MIDYDVEWYIDGVWAYGDRFSRNDTEEGLARSMIPSIEFENITSLESVRDNTRHFKIVLKY